MKRKLAEGVLYTRSKKDNFHFYFVSIMRDPDDIITNVTCMYSVIIMYNNLSNISILIKIIPEKHRAC